MTTRESQPKLTDEEILELPILLNVSQVEALLGISRRGVQLLTSKGKLPGKKVGRNYLFNRDCIFDIVGIDYESVKKSVLTRQKADRRLEDEVSGDTDATALLKQAMELLTNEKAQHE